MSPSDRTTSYTATTTTTPSKSPSFFVLPVELRLQVYSHITLTGGSTFDYRGILLSCKKIHFELLYSLLNHTAAHIQSVKDTWKSQYAAPLLVSSPSTLAGLSNLLIKIPRIILNDALEAARAPKIIKPLFAFHFDKGIKMYLYGGGAIVNRGCPYYQSHVARFLYEMKFIEPIGGRWDYNLEWETLQFQLLYPLYHPRNFLA